jgi:hypothetical protein
MRIVADLIHGKLTGIRGVPWKIDRRWKRLSAKSLMIEYSDRNILTSP